MGRGGLEPPTSRLSGVRSNHLSYRPKARAVTRFPFLKRYEGGLDRMMRPVRLTGHAKCSTRRASPSGQEHP